MGINSTLYRSLIFGGVDSADYDIYISGDGVYNAPERSVEMVSVAGRNGAIALDAGHWENIEIEYPAGMYAESQTEFATKLSNYRNAIASQIGYKRLEDTYHPEEFRMAMYISGLEVEPVAWNKAGEFKIKFNAKPQRWLTAGETAVTVSNGDTLTNPTLLDAQPLLAIDGYGTVGFNGYSIEINNEPLGEVLLLGEETIEFASITSATRTFDTSSLRSGDPIWFGIPNSVNPDVRFYSGGIDSVSSQTISFTDSNPDVTGNVEQTFSFYQLTFAFGTPKTITNTRTITSSNYPDETATVVGTVTYDGADTITITFIRTPSEHLTFDDAKSSVYYRDLKGDSSLAPANSTIYIDCELGDAYMIDNNNYISLNAYIELGSDLPVLASGGNTFTIDDTITALEVTPRWWKL